MKNKYSISEFISTGYSLLLTKVFYPKARLIRRPLYMRGKKSILWGVNFTTGHYCRFDLDGTVPTLVIGDNCELGDNTHIVALNNVKIGNNVLVASKVFISDTNHGSNSGNNQDSPLIPPNDRKLISKEVIIGDNVWIGENVVILPGTTIGNGCIIGANSVVSGTFENSCILVGAPARVVKKWNGERQVWEKISG